MKLRHLLLAASLLSPVLGAPAYAAVIGQNVPAEAITAARIAALPADQQKAWRDYLARSEAQKKADKAALAAEREGLTQFPEQSHGHGHDNSMPLDKDISWYASAEAKHIGDNIVSFQTPAGGWGKNADRAGPLRLKGQAYVTNNLSGYLTENDFDAPVEPDWNYVGTFDNNATDTEMHFLAKLAKALPGKEGNAYRASFIKGLKYILAAQFPNGGWPQVWPLEGGYHDAITYNDNAVSEAAAVMTDVSENKDGDFDFVPAALRDAAAQSAAKALEVILATQVSVQGKPAIWGQQHDALTLKPCSARNFEPPALASDESAALLVYLMSLPNPSLKLQAAIHSGMAFLAEHTITNISITGKSDPGGKHAVIKDGSKPIWARYYDAATGTPVFGERDKSLHDSMNDLSEERRNGYSWYVSSPEKAIQAYMSWSSAHQAKN
ncbi:PelA/Pel-15E family pectate lyase [Rhizomicrobium palustre]|uniref:PelA/Pel-15E family pectate lyase n=1 Tax=Rhizomicrobium palustre TaxID=189966 RepID=A0A846N051_9PROT|nr:pectate lyase [Rhizomicrobium palustre]NIK88933.1 PelA/Pel-15E family pectate lyase [Rhizomicrobium palustre]